MTLSLYNCRITYYRMEGYYTPHIHAPVLHIEKDLTNPNNLIIAHWSSLKILDQNFQEHLIAGQTETSGFRDGEGSNALFTWVTSFIQSDTRHVLVVDHYSHCIRVIDRQTNGTSTYADICEYGGHNDQGLSQSRFYNPYTILRHPNNLLYVSDEFNNAIRRISGVTVSTIVRNSPLIKPRGMSFDRLGEHLYATIRHGMVKVVLSNNYVTRITQSSNGYADGTLGTSHFSNPYGISRVTDSTYIVADYGNSVLRIVDTVAGRVSSICTGIFVNHYITT